MQTADRESHVLPVNQTFAFFLCAFKYRVPVVFFCWYVVCWLKCVSFLFSVFFFSQAGQMLSELFKIIAGTLQKLGVIT